METTNPVLSNATIQLKMMELIVRINLQSFEHSVTCAGKLLLIFECLLRASHGGPSNTHFSYILDLKDKVMEKLATMQFVITVISLS